MTVLQENEVNKFKNGYVYNFLRECCSVGALDTLIKRVLNFGQNVYEYNKDKYCKASLDYKKPTILLISYNYCLDHMVESLLSLKDNYTWCDGKSVNMVIKEMRANERKTMLTDIRSLIDEYSDDQHKVVAVFIDGVDFSDIPKESENVAYPYSSDREPKELQKLAWDINVPIVLTQEVKVNKAILDGDTKLDVNDIATSPHITYIMSGRLNSFINSSILEDSPNPRMFNRMDEYNFPYTGCDEEEQTGCE